MTRQTICLLAMALSCAALSEAFAQPGAPGASPTIGPSTDGAGDSGATGPSVPATADERSGVPSEETMPRRSPPERPVMPEVEEVETRRPSGFWTSTRPAKGGAYRYRLLAIGVSIAVITLVFMVWLVRRKMREPT